MTDYTLPELKSVPNADSSDANLNIVSAARGALCSAYRAVPGAFVYPAGDPQSLSDDVKDSFRRTLDNICGDNPLPPQDPGTPGGRCAIYYNIGYNFTFTRADGSVSSLDYTAQLLGPIGSVQIIQSPTDSSNWRWQFTYGNPAAPYPMGDLLKNSYESLHASAKITSITPVTPGTDICGSRPPQFQPKPAPPGIFNPNVPFSDRGIVVNIPVNIPPIVIPPGAVSFSPSFTVGIPGGKIVFDARGAKVSLDISPSLKIQLGGDSNSGNPNPPVKFPKGIDPIALSDRLDYIDQQLKDLIKCACKNSDKGTLDVTLVQEGTSGCIAVSITRNKYVAFAITQSPQNKKRQFGNTSPDVVYCGWAWFKALDYLFERFPIDAEGKIYGNPGGASAFCYTLYEGYRGKPILLDEPIPPSVP